ncbi:MAG: hypothetical protein WBW58_04710, partial [Candidatus Acidiferrum sp.]
QDPVTGLCARHATCAETVPDGFQDTTDLFKEILTVNTGSYGSTEGICCILSNIVELLAKGRISPRRASVITFALSLMLRSVVVHDRQNANAPTQIIFDAPRPPGEYDHLTSAAQSGNSTYPEAGAAARQETSNGASHNASKTYFDVCT